MVSKSPTNWIDLPMEMRVECVKWMDFQSRMSLRATSYTEKLIVESAPKYHFDSVQILLGTSTYIRYKVFESQNVRAKASPRNPNDCKLVAQLLKFAVINHFRLQACRPKLYKAFVLAGKGPFRIKNLKLECRSHILVDHFLKNCEGVEKMVLIYPLRGNPASYPSVICAKNVDLRFSGDPDRLCELIKKWIENDVDIGKSLGFPLNRHKVLQFRNSLDSKFENRVHYSSRSELCLRMDNNSKHILIKSTGASSIKNYTVTVIASSEKHGEEDEE